MAVSTQTDKGRATRQKILDATSELIVEKGLDGFTVSAIARRGNVNRALIYHYFRDRDNLITHAIDNLMTRYDTPETRLSGDAVARSARMYIEHPEIGRFIFQLLLAERPLLRLRERFREMLAHVEQMKRQQAPHAKGDPRFGMVVLALSQFSWSVAREELAMALGMTVEEADERFVDEMRRVSELGLQALFSSDVAAD